MEDIKAIDIQNRVFSVRPETTLKPFFYGYEMQVVAKATWKGAILKRGLPPGEEWRVIAEMSAGNVPNLLKEMDACGIDLVFMEQLKLWSYHDHKVQPVITLKDMDEIVTEAGSKIVPGGGYNPFQIMESLEELQLGVKEHGYKYMWFHPSTYGIRVDDREITPAYAKCQELGIPVCLQVGMGGEPVPFEGAHPVYMDLVALDFPELKIVLTHTGFPWIQEWIAMCWKHPNVYGCINGYMPKDLDPAIVKFMDGPGRDKVMWGTNGWDMKRCKNEFMELPIRDANKKKILRDNVIKVFNLNISP